MTSLRAKDDLVGFVLIVEVIGEKRDFMSQRGNLKEAIYRQNGSK